MRRQVIIFSIFLISLSLFAGDTAQFCSIGWSNDYHYFAFAQFGEQDGSGFPYAELYIVDVEKNDFVKDGVLKRLWQDDGDAATKGLHALLALYVQADSILTAYEIKVNQQVRPNFNCKEAECIDAHWKNGDTEYTLSLIQKAQGDPGSYECEAAFHLSLQQQNEKPIIIGNKNRFRKYVLRYDLDRILQSPDRQYLVVVIQITKLGFEGPDIRYMVESIKLP